jgi:hypothetical protein
MSPADAFARQNKALRLLRRGVGVRAVARAVGCSPSSVVRWRDAQAAQGDRTAGQRAFRRWDAHGTGGRRWDANAKQRARGEAFRRRARAVALGEAPATHSTVLDHYDHPDFVAERARIVAEPAFWDDNPELVRRARIRLSVDAHQATRGAADAWTSAALPLLFAVPHLSATPADLYRTAEERERVAIALLERTARAAGFVQDSAGVWHLGDDEG